MDTVAGKFSGVTREPDVDVTSITKRVKDAVRNNYPIGPTGKVVIKCFAGVRAADSAFAKQLALKLFGFGIHRKTRVARLLVLFDQLGDVDKLGVSIRGFSARS